MITQDKKGYSIVEILVYLAIFTAMSVLVINSFIVIISSFNTTNMNRKLLEAGSVPMERISREIRQAETIGVDSTGDTLVLNTHDSLGNNLVIKFALEGSQLNLYKDDVLQAGLLGQNMSITSLVFRRITTTQSEAVKIEMTIQYEEGKDTKSENFYNTIVLRGGY
jgi:Tfp pilus assembly protein PilW